MATKEHLNLSNFIKSFHKNLRAEAKILGVEQAWQEHCKKDTQLNKYASAMQELATKHWEPNYKKEIKPKFKAVSRVEWISKFSQQYFHKSEKERQRQREREIGLKLDINIPDEYFNELDKIVKLRLLDVGSCYNPFKNFNYDVIAIDIAPANADVYKCDFLNLNIIESVPLKNNDVEYIEMQTNTFDIIVFSLYLEYLPSTTQRYLSCEKAYKLLKSEGLLFIITPDSKHVGANAKLMISWRHILARLGFSRIKYEKLPHMHCMAFRKSLRKEIANRWADLHQKPDLFSEMFIPQDFGKDNNDYNAMMQ